MAKVYGQQNTYVTLQTSDINEIFLYMGVNDITDELTESTDVEDVYFYSDGVWTIDIERDSETQLYTLYVYDAFDRYADGETIEHIYVMMTKKIAMYTFNSDTDTLPTFNDGYTYEYIDADNGDGTITRTIFSDSLPTSISFKNKTGLVSLSYLDTSNITSMNNMFYYCENLTSIDLNNFNTSKVTNMYLMFESCTKLTSLDVSSFDTSNVILMGSMFGNCNNLTSIEGLSNFNTSKVTNMFGMFGGCTKLTSLDLSNWDINNVTYIESMFYNCSNLTSINMNNSDVNSINKIINRLPTRTTDSPGTMNIGTTPISSVDTTTADSKYWNIYAAMAKYTFSSSTDTLPTFNDGYVYTYTDVDNGDGTITRTVNSDSLPSSISFNGKTGLVSLSYLDTSNVTTMEYMFGFCKSLTSLDLSSFDTSNVKNMQGMFWNCINLTSLDLSNFNTSNVTDIGSMFASCTNLTTLDLSNFDTSNVENISGMFGDCKNLTSLDLSNFDTKSVDTMGYMFDNCNNLITVNMDNSDVDSINDIINELPTRTVDSYGTLKSGAILASTCDIETASSKYWNVNDDVVVIYTFNSSTDTLPTYFGDIDYDYTDVNNGNGTTTRTITAESLPTHVQFYGRKSLLSIDYLNVINMNHMYAMFAGCSALTSINTNGWNTSSVDQMQHMFDGCTSLVSLDLSSFNTSKVTDMDEMFRDCTKLTTLDLSSFDTSKVTDMSYMFYNCNTLTTVNMKNSNVDSINDIITELPTRTADNPGTLKSGAILASNCDIETASSKYWNVDDDVVVIYTFNSSTDTLPTFNDGYTYKTISLTVDESVILPNRPASVNNLTCEIIYTDGTTALKPFEYYNNDGYEYYSASLDGTSNHSVEIEKNSNDEWYAYISYGGFSFLLDIQSINVTIPFIAFTDVDNGDGTTIRTITSDSLPTNISFNGKSGLVSLSYLDTSNITSMKEMFYECNNLASIDVSNFNTSNVTDMSDMFNECNNLTSLDLSSFDTSKVTDMNRMFCDCTKLESLDLSNFNTSNVTSMIAMFYNCKNLPSIDLSNFNTSNVTDMSYMFNNCKKLTSIDVSNFNTSNVTDMNSMFYGCHNLTSLDLSSFNTSNVTSMSYIFYNCSSLTSLDLSNFNTSNVNNFYQMFYNCSSLTSLDLSNFNTSNVNNFYQMFYNCSSLTSLDLSNFNTSNVTTMGEMFNGCNNLTTVDMKNSDVDSINKIINILPTRTAEKYGVIMVYDFDPSINKSTANSKYWNIYTKIATYTFNSSTDTLPSFNYGLAYAYTDVDNGDSTITRTITSDNLPTRVQFYGTKSLLSIDYLNVGNINNMNAMFAGCSALTSINTNGWNTSKVTDMRAIFDGCTSLVSLDLSSFNTSNVTKIGCMFENCSNLLSLNLSNFNTSKVTNMDYMFYNCKKLTSLDLSNFNTSEVTNMDRMFYGCSNLTSLNLSNFDTSKVTRMDYMFYDCSKLTSLDLSSFNTSEVTDMDYMFYNCSKLTSIDLSNFNLKESAYDIPEGLFTNSPMLKIIKANNCNLYTLSLILRGLPTVVRGKGIVYKLNDNEWCDKINTVTIESKNWKVCLRPGYHKKNITIGERYL